MTELELNIEELESKIVPSAAATAIVGAWTTTSAVGATNGADALATHALPNVS